ncbi:MAG: chromosome partitioning protein ParA, partial [Nitrospirae bacterium]
GELDFLIIDCPPGTGDEPLTIAQLLDKPVGAIVVTTPQDVAMVNVRKSITFCKHLKLPVVGIVENMSGFVCEKCGEVTEIFKSGGAEKLSKEFGVPFLGKIPLDPLVAISGDEGKPCVLSYKESETAKAYKKITEKVVEMTKELSEPVGAKDIKKLTIAMPVSNGSLCSHFGHCEEFVLFDVDTDKKTILRERRLTPPPHEPGVLPNWLEEQGAHLIIAAGMGVKAQNLFAEKGIVVIPGVEQKQIEEIVKDYLEDKLVTGENICDH